MAEDRVTSAIVETIIQEIEEGNFTISTEHLADRYYGDRAYGNEVLAGINKRMGKISAVLLELYGYQSCNVSKRAFGKPKKDESPLVYARNCLAWGGAGKGTAGIHVCTGSDDEIFKAAIQLGVSLSGGQSRRALDILLEAFDQDNLTAEAAYALLTEIKERGQPTHPERVEQVKDRRLEEIGAGK